MTISAAFLELMPSTVTIYTNASRDAYGKRTASATGTAGLTVDDKVVLPDSTEVRISGVETSNDEDGTHHTVIRYGD